MSFLLDGDRVPVTKQDRIDLEKLRLMEEILAALKGDKKDAHRGELRESKGNHDKRLSDNRPDTGSVRGRGRKPRSDNE